MILDQLLPQYDVRERHTKAVGTAPAAALAATRALTVREVPVLLVLMSLRGVPAMLSGKRPLAPRQVILGAFKHLGFQVASETDEELALVAVGRFWRLDGGLRAVRAGDFPDFAQPGWAKVAFDFRAVPRGAGSELSTETRVQATDEDSRRSFLRYWRVTSPGSALIRRDWLRAAKRRAEG